MKKYFTIMAIALVGALVSGCGSAGTIDDNFGYSRPESKPEPVKSEPKASLAEKDIQVDNWQNPLAGDNSVDNAVAGSAVMAGNNNNVVYVPVIVPWWYDYYGWMGYPSYRYRHTDRKSVV